MRLKATALLLALVGAACNAETTLPPVGFPTCTPIPQGRSEHVEGLVLPPGAHVLRAKPTGKRLIQVRGYIEMNPVQIRRFYEELETKPRYRFILLEDEVIEAEAFFTNGKWRNFVRARTSCEGRSELFVLVAPEDYGEKITGRPSTATPSP